MEKPAENLDLAGTKLIVRVLQDLVKADTFASYADLAEAVKCRCARLRIPYDAGLVSDAIDRLELGGKAPIIAPPTKPQPAAEPAPVTIDRQTAASVVRQLLDRYHAEHDDTTHPLRDVTPVRQLTPEAIGRRQFRQDRRKAFELVRQAIEDTAARCDALEAAITPTGDDV